MIRLFFIKNKFKNQKLVNNDKKILEKYTNIAQKSKDEILNEFNSNIEKGLSSKIIEEKHKNDEKNIVVKEEKHSWFYFFINSFKDKFIFILIVLAIINKFVGDDTLGTIIILAIGFASALIRFFQDYSTYKFNQSLKSKLFSTATVIRNGKEKNIKTEDIVLGDIVHLNAGSIIPADVMILESKDLFLNQSVFTGESAPIEKKDSYIPSNEIFSLSNICLMGTSVISGKATGIVISTGFTTYLGNMGKQIDNKKEITNFEKGMNNITKLLIKYMLVVSIAVFIIYALIRKDVLEAILFALSVAVGITPTMLPMIVNVNLTKGTKTLAKKKTLVKNIQSIQNLGAIDVLCTDKTGTLTLDKIVLQKYINVEGKEDLSILEYAYLNSYYGTGMKNLVDKAVITYGNEHNIKEKIVDYEKVDEIPFDYTRKIMSVVVKHDDHYRIITKGALEEILKRCTTVKINGEHKDLTQNMIANINSNAKDLALQGMQVIALASKREYSGKDIFNSSDESEMVFIGFVAFLDPPKKDVKTTIKNLKEYGVTTKILTGDNQYATENVSRLVGIPNDKILTGSDIDKMSDDELSKQVEDVDIFARMNPLQKERIITILKKNGHVVGYMGDGVNDAPSLHNADVGICVNTATDIAKETGNMIITDDNFSSIVNGVEEGRRAYNNIRKVIYLLLSTGLSEIILFVLAMIFNFPIPLVAIQLLWLNLISNGIQSNALAFEKDVEDVMNRPANNEKIFDKLMINEIIISATVMGIIEFALYIYLYNIKHLEIEVIRSYLLTLMVLMENIHIFNCRSERISAFKISGQNNKFLIFSILITCLIQIIVVRSDILSNILRLKTIPLEFAGGLVVFSIPLIIIMEVYKKFVNK